MGLSLIQPND